jgi:DNA-binding XRE family transcriptional regulator
LSRPERPLNPDGSALERFGFHLRRYRKARGLSQDRLAALVHVSGDLIQRIEVGQRRPARGLAASCDEALQAGGQLVREWEAYRKAADTDRRSVGISAGAGHGAAPKITVNAGSHTGFLVARTDVVELSADDMLLRCRAQDGRVLLVTVPRRDLLAAGTGGVLTVAQRTESAFRDSGRNAPASRADALSTQCDWWRKPQDISGPN